ncbi:hypothetical protein, partial [Flavobacterium sp. PL002]
MKNNNRFFLLISSILFLTLISSCATYKGNYTTNTITLPLDIDRLKGKWIIDEPILEKIDASYNSKVIESYKKLLSSKIKILKEIGEFKNTYSLNKS